MRILDIAPIAFIASALVITSSPVLAATAHNSQAGSYGPSSNVTDSTPSSPHVKHAAKHRGMQR